MIFLSSVSEGKEYQSLIHGAHPSVGDRVRFGKMARVNRNSKKSHRPGDLEKKGSIGSKEESGMLVRPATLRLHRLEEATRIVRHGSTIHHTQKITVTENVLSITRSKIFTTEKNIWRISLHKFLIHIANLPIMRKEHKRENGSTSTQ